MRASAAKCATRPASSACPCCTTRPARWPWPNCWRSSIPTSLILPHLGSFGDDWAAQLALIDHLARHRNIHADSSGVRRFDLLQQAVRRAGPHKVLFGSDGPWLHPGLELHKIQLLGLPPADAALITGGNFLRLARLA
ncbi:amidohydrolase family protein [Janthinobacterium sp. SUN033]|uniref:amidohydrolase family protein n=1 Tax=Janthinobacterium sp. SUN033 TaxID=3002439 RepID=UPI0025B09CDF|nr:amidohydrolase family protein [Janthinobacterium sp. SUN033]MDN2675860.1 amidohydrolase family protein [Janthinobacterium sp. SUN033]